MSEEMERLLTWVKDRCQCLECMVHFNELRAAVERLEREREQTEDRVSELERMISALECSRINYIRRDGKDVRLIETDCGAMVCRGEGQTLQMALIDAADKLGILKKAQSSRIAALEAEVRLRELLEALLRERKSRQARGMWDIDDWECRHGVSVAEACEECGAGPVFCADQALAAHPSEEQLK